MPGNIVSYFRMICSTKFTKNIGKAVQMLTTAIKLQSKKKFGILRESGFSASRHFEIFVKNYALMYFINGFEARRFLLFCAFVTDFAIRYYLHGAIEAPHHAAAIIAEVLTDNKDVFILNGNWEFLNEESIGYIRGSFSRQGCFNCFRALQL
ncbi:hypothetical protein NPIL_344801 [Nephila pilipes]|uniref:Uncharacterized protein n=1 Tax=Nephila pilipes TaxID=299642 RepID=A0A8X6MSL1_NEPPI|nr:hypothetical protein NPIL_344801 [Nephila pilipes]